MTPHHAARRLRPLLLSTFLFALAGCTLPPRGYRPPPGSRQPVTFMVQDANARHDAALLFILVRSKNDEPDSLRRVVGELLHEEPVPRLPFDLNLTTLPTTTTGARLDGEVHIERRSPSALRITATIVHAGNRYSMALNSSSMWGADLHYISHLMEEQNADPNEEGLLLIYTEAQP